MLLLEDFPPDLAADLDDLLVAHLGAVVGARRLECNCARLKSKPDQVVQPRRRRTSAGRRRLLSASTCKTSLAVRVPSGHG